MRKYRLVAKKGEGTFSEVLKAQNVKDGKYHAIKCMKNRFDTIDQVNNLREIQALRRLSPHEHIISLEEVLYDQPTGRLALVFELMDANLYELIRGRRHYLNPSLIKSYMWQLMKSLDHMHKKGIFHRDIKPENILIESTSDVGRGLKLADFGSCRGIYSKQPYTEYISTRWYRAPECLLTDGYYGPEMDLWGAGCVMFEITSLYPLFPGQNEVDQINRIHKVLGTPPAEVLNKFKSKGASHISFDFPPQKGIGIPQLVPHASPDCIDLMVKMLKYDASERITAREAMRHPYFKELREQEAKQQAEGRQQVAQAGSSTMPVSSTTGAGASASSAAAGSGAPSAAARPLPSIGHNSDAQSVKTVNTNADAQSNYQPHYLMGQKPTVGSQVSSINAQSTYKNTGSVAPSAGGTSTLPPIVMAGQSGTVNAQGKYTDSKNGRTANQASNQQKKRKKYRMNYAQQQRVVQNSESVMKAYGVPKIFGAQSSAAGNDGVSAGGNVSYMRYDGSKVASGLSALAPPSGVSGGGFGGAGGSFGLYQQQNKGGGNVNKKY